MIIKKPEIASNNGDVGSPVLAALVSGAYVAIFYVSQNLTMLPWSSILLMVAALIVPIALSVVILTYVFKRQRWRGVKFLSIFMCVVYVFFLMRLPVFEVEAIANTVGAMPTSLRIVTKLSYCVFPAILFAFLCRKSVNGYIFTLTILCISALTMPIVTHYSNKSSPNLVRPFGSATESALSNVRMSSTPNIYLVLTDGYSNFAYLDENDFDSAELKSTLKNNGFTLYPEMFSNYHPTLAAMPAVLNMEHHYYSASQSNNITETSRSARVIIGGNNNVVNFLKNNNYETRYIHHGTYLLLQGCTASSCYPDISFAGARAILSRLFPNPVGGDRLFETVPINQILDTAKDLRTSRAESNRPQFEYMHIYNPAHTANEVAGRCNMQEELESYKSRTSDTNKTLSKVLSSIIEYDPSAVIVLTSDHGPFISKQCAQNADIDSLSAYRDRVGALTAIRWPADYDGRYDDRMLTTVNLFRYVFASLVTNDRTILSSAVADDVYIKGKDHVLKVMGEGKVLLPPVVITP